MRLRKTLIGILVAVVLLYGGCLGWLYSQHLLFNRRIVLKVPIRLEKGFTLKQRFTVDTPVKYWVGIQYDEVFRITPKVPFPQGEFAADFELTSMGKLVTRGSAATISDWEVPWAITRDRVTQYLGVFDGKPGQSYDLSLEVRATKPRLRTKHADAIIQADWGFDEFYPVRNVLLSIVGIVILILLCLVVVWRTRKEQ